MVKKQKEKNRKGKNRRGKKQKVKSYQFISLRLLIKANMVGEYRKGADDWYL